MLGTAVGVVVFLGVVGAAALVRATWRAHKEAEDVELARRLGAGSPTTSGRLVRRRGPGPWWMGGGWTGLALLVERAGSKRPLWFHLAISAALALVGWGVVAWVRPGPISLLGLAVGAAPWFRLRARARARTRENTRLMPEALDLMVRALRSGHGFSEALRVAGTRVPAPLSEVLSPAAEELRLGLDLRTVLDGLVVRMPDNFEMRLFATSVLLHRETGGNLIEILEQLSDTIRERLVFEHKVKALTAEVRMSARILEALPFLAALGLMIAAPTYLLPLADPGLGRQLLLFGALSMMAGILVMRRIAEVEP